MYSQIDFNAGSNFYLDIYCFVLFCFLLLTSLKGNVGAINKDSGNIRICKSVTIGENSIVAANSVVTKSIPSNCIAAGNPARVVKTEIDKLDY